VLERHSNFILPNEVNVHDGCQQSSEFALTHTHRHNDTEFTSWVTPECLSPFRLRKLRAQIIWGKDEQGALCLLGGLIHLEDKI
jgi:hypothetical protein